MRAGGTLRLFHCHPAAPAFDEAIRSTIVPHLLATPAIEHVWAARQGPDEAGLRVIASVWAPTDMPAVADGMGMTGGSDAPEDHPGAGSRELETLPILRSVAADGSIEVGILRVSRGVLRDLDVDRYADDVIDGLDDDLRGGHGPHALVLADAGGRAFVTVSVWSDWARIEVATGASIRDPIRTRRRTDLTSFGAEHFELLAAARPPRG